MPGPGLGRRVLAEAGMSGEAIQVTRKGIRVKLDPDHVGEGEPDTVTLDRSYTAEHVSLGYASTPDRGQGATHDHSLYAASDRASLERGYVALSRGRTSNEVFATKGQAWEKALEDRRAHEPAIQQQPTAHAGDETQRPMERERDRWLADRVRQLDTERQARDAAHDEDEGRRRDEGRGRGMAM